MKQFKYGLGVVVLGGMLLAPAAGFASSWSCKHGNLTREVIIQYSGKGPVPCSVVYNKPDEGKTSKVLWNAESQQGYCEAKAKAFVAKLQGWGWACTSDAESTPAATAPVAAPAAKPEETAQPAQPAPADATPAK